MPQTYAQLMELANGYAGSKALLVANELGLFTAIGTGWRTAEDLAVRCKADRDGLRLLLNALAGMGLLRRRGSRYGNTALGRLYLDGQSPTAITNLLWLLNHHWSDWTEMAAAIRSGRRSWAALTSGASFRRRFALAMHERSHILAPPTVAAMRLPRGAARFLDVAGGPGSYAIALASRHPGLTGTIVDQHVATAHAVIRRHNFNERENRALLGRMHAALRPGGKLFIVEFFLDETLAKPTEAAVFSLVMYKFTASGRSYGWAEVEAWLRALGFGRFRRRRITSGVGLLEAVKMRATARVEPARKGSTAARRRNRKGATRRSYRGKPSGADRRGS
jgi:hypothetical protein